MLPYSHRVTKTSTSTLRLSEFKVVVFLSGYLKKHHSTLFHPPLPLHKLLSVQRLGFGTNNKIFVEFDSPWWDADCEVIFFVWDDEVRFHKGILSHLNKDTVHAVLDLKQEYISSYLCFKMFVGLCWLLDSLLRLECLFNPFSYFRMLWWTRCQMCKHPG